jgi:MYXO-CTERM domain-containing protein
VKGGCEIDCQGKEGALFCDGQYVDHGDNLQMCIDALKARLNVNVMASSSGNANCDGGVCTAEGAASVKSDCSVAQPGGRGHHGDWWLGLVGVAAALMFRSRRGRRA